MRDASVEIAPERAEYLRRAIVALAATITAQMLAEAGSTDSGLLGRLLAPQLPRLRDLLLSRLSEADPVRLEQTLSAAAWAIEAILADAPGEPLPRMRPDWDEAGALILRPADA